MPSESAGHTIHRHLQYIPGLKSNSICSSVLNFRIFMYMLTVNYKILVVTLETEVAQSISNCLGTRQFEFSSQQGQVFSLCHHMHTGS